MESKQLLERYFGYDKFLSGQEELINHILSGRNVLGIMPTGGGKSICYQLPGLIFDGLTIVISPLISLMKDQVNLLRANDIDSAYINSSLSRSEYYSVISGISSGKYKIIYIAPERLESDGFLEIVRENRVSMVAVDEAHCVSQWGHDFRPSYLKIRNFISKLEGNPVVAAFTATATENVKQDIIDLIGLKKHELISTGYDRKNLYFEVRRPKDKFQEILEILDLEKGNSGIIYCNTRKLVEDVCSKLIKSGYDATRYHAGLGSNERNNNQEMFILDKKLIMVATNAFGMGIDKSNVNFVIHYNMPKNLENYYQEAGRAGRDGSPAKCILLYSYQDVVINKFLIEKTIESENYKDSKLKEKLINKNLDLLNKIKEYCTTRGCYRQYILDYFGDSTHSYTGGCDNCYNCSGDFELVDVNNEAFHIISAIGYLKSKNKRFGKRMVIDILKGSNTKKIKELSFNTIPSFNKLNNKSKDEIGLIIDFLVDKKYLRISGDKYPVIQLWKNYDDILNGLISLEMKFSSDEINKFREVHEDKNVSKVSESKNISKVHKNKRISRDYEGKIESKGHGKENISRYIENQDNRRNNKLISNKTQKIPFNDQIDNVLFEKLRKVRLNIARNKNIPPFLIFHDSTLKDICKKLPTSDDEFLEVSGVGKVKMEKYGEIFINEVNIYASKLANNSLISENKDKTINQSKSVKEGNENNKYNKYNKNNKQNKNIKENKNIKRNKSNESSKSNNLNVDVNLFKKLKEIRLKLSKNQGVPAYIIFHDSTLEDICRKLPTSEDEFLEVSGVGKVKMEKYGNLFIERIKEYKSNKYSKKSQNKGKFDLTLFNKLKKLRLNIANDEDIPPFIIFSDNTLRELSTVIPNSKSDFLKISGVTHVKMKKYGKYFLNVIKKYNQL